MMSDVTIRINPNTSLATPEQPEVMVDPNIPVKGQTWYIRAADSDVIWPRESPGVKIIDAKSGWVRYSIGQIFNDQRMPLDQFVSVYTPVKGGQ